MNDAMLDFLCVSYLDSIIPDDETLRANSYRITDEEWREMDELVDSLWKYLESCADAELSGTFTK